MNKPFSWPVRVYYEDTDFGGVVYYANYLKFMERARTELLRACGVEQDRAREEDGIIFVVVSVEVQYRAPAKFNELLEVTAVVSEARRASLTFTQAVARDGELLCEGTVRVACVDAATLKPRALPAGLGRAIA